MRSVPPAGCKLSGLDVYISSNVPKGSGVSSSAAFEVLIGVILNDCFMTKKVSPIAIAQIGQWAENVYFGKPCGLMDQMASSVGNIITIDFADPAHPDVEPVPVDFSKAGLALCILDSCADHADLTDEYAAVPAECRAVAAVCGGEVLRDVPFETFLAKLPECRRQCGDRAVLRAFHIYADNDRVAKQVAALREGDFDTFLRLVTESGHSSWEYLQNVIPAGYKEHQEMGVTIAAAKHYLNGKGRGPRARRRLCRYRSGLCAGGNAGRFQKAHGSHPRRGPLPCAEHPPGRRRCPVISTAIQQLVNYGLDTGLILPDDEIYIRNQLLMTMQLDGFTAPGGRGVLHRSGKHPENAGGRCRGPRRVRGQFHRPRPVRHQAHGRADLRVPASCAPILRSATKRRPAGRHRLVL